MKKENTYDDEKIKEALLKAIGHPISKMILAVQIKDKPAAITIIKGQPDANMVTMLNQMVGHKLDKAADEQKRISNWIQVFLTTCICMAYTTGYDIEDFFLDKLVEIMVDLKARKEIRKEDRTWPQ